MSKFTIVLAVGVSILALGSAQAADLIIDEPAVIPGVVDVGGNWDGVFIGAFGGYAGGGQSLDGDDFDDLEGWLAGGAVGANFTVTDGIVAGVVADLAWADIAAEGPATIDWVGSLRGRVGFDGGVFMPYLTAGLAVAGANVGGEDNTHLGWTGGAGVEFAATEDLSVDLQYRYSDYADQAYAGGDVGFTTHQATIGVNWKF